MKKQILVLLVGLFALNLQAQLVLTTTGSGIVAVSYEIDTDFYDPLGADHIYLYMWINADQTDPELPFPYNDEWSEPTSLVVINWSSGDNKFLGEINFNTHDFLGEGVLQEGTQINDFNLLLRNEAGDHQTSDLLASDYGFTSTQTLSQIDYQVEKASYYNKGTLFLNALKNNEIIEVLVFDSAGKQIYKNEFLVKQTSVTVDLSNLQKNFVIVQVKTSANKFFVKKIVL